MPKAHISEAGAEMRTHRSRLGSGGLTPARWRTGGQAARVAINKFADVSRRERAIGPSGIIK